MIHGGATTTEAVRHDLVAWVALWSPGGSVGAVDGSLEIDQRVKGRFRHRSVGEDLRSAQNQRAHSVQW